MITIKINSEPYDMPTSWDDLQFHQYNTLLNATENTEWTELMAKWLGLDYVAFQGATVIGLEPVMAAMSFVSVPPVWGTENPKRVREFLLPGNITLETVIQYEHMKKYALAAKGFKEKVSDYPLIVAIYCQKIRDGEYNFSKAQALADEFQKANAREIIEAGNFFLIKLNHLNSGSQPSSPSPSQTQKKPESSESWVNSASKRFSTTWRMLLGKGPLT